MNNKQKARTQFKGVEGKDYSIIYDHDGNLVKCWHASHRIDKISNTDKKMHKKRLKEQHHAQMYNMCFQRLQKYYIDRFYKDDAVVEIIQISLKHMKYKQIVKFYDVLKKNGFDKY